MSRFRAGDRVTWTYWHSIYPGRPFQREKKGEFFRLVCHRCVYWQRLGLTQLACVLLDGNHSLSRVPLDQLRRCEP